MPRRSTARLLAPAALVASLVAVVIVVQAARPKGDSGSSGTSTTQRDGTARTTTSAAARSSRRRSAKVYVVKSGDILSSVAAKTGVSVARIQELNPDLDAQALQVGQKIKLSGDAPTP